MKLFNSLWTKISLAVVLMIVCVMSLVTYVFTISQIKTQRAELRTNMGRIAKQIASIRLAETEGWYVYQDWIDNIIDSDLGEDLVYIAISDEKDSLAAFALNDEWLDLGNQNYLTLEEQINIVKRLSQGQVAKESVMDFDRQIIDIRWGREFLGKVDVGFSLIEFNDSVRRRLLTNLVLLTVFSFLGVIGSVVMSHRITRPLNKLSGAMLEVSHGNLDQTLHVSRKDEIGELANSFNSMIADLREKAIIEKFGRELRYSFRIDKAAELVTGHLVEAIHAESGALFLIEKRGKYFGARLAHCHPQTDCTKNEYPFPLQCYNVLKGNKEPKPVEYYDLQPSFINILEKIRQSAIIDDVHIVSPIVGNDRLFGFLLLAGKSDRSGYLAKDYGFLATLTDQATLAIENAILVRELTEQERLKRELEIARNIQQRLLPAGKPRVNGLDVSGICIPATEVGGDYYDFFMLNGNKLGIAIADVAGKGTFAAFYMAEIKGMMSSLVNIIESPRELLSEINKRLYASLDRKLFATMIYGVFDLSQKTLTFVRAGHNALMIKRHNQNGNVDLLIPSGIGLGLTDSPVFRDTLAEEVVRLSSGDVVLFYTDGISEAMSKDREEFGEAKLADLLRNAKNSETEFLQQHILKEIHRFVRNAPQHDDITMVLSRVT